MGLLDLFKRKETAIVIPKGFFAITVKDKVSLTADSIKIVFEIPSIYKEHFVFVPGQYVNIAARINHTDIRRSYSICSGTDEDLAIGVKRVEKGIFSNYALDHLAVGDEIWVSKPMGNFKWNENASRIVAFAAGSGITPILSIAKSAQEKGQQMHLFYGNKSIDNTMFLNDLKSLSSIQTTLFLTKEKRENTYEGRLTKESLSKIFDADSSLLTADAYYLCGPQDMVERTQALLLERGVNKANIHFELFTIQPTEETIKPKATGGKTAVTVICDQEEFHFEMDAKTTVLQKALDHDVDAPYSCRGGVCCTCKAKVIEGSASMNVNLTLSEQEVKQGYILTCQAYPTSEKLVISYDE